MRLSGRGCSGYFIGQHIVIEKLVLMGPILTTNCEA